MPADGNWAEPMVMAMGVSGLMATLPPVAPLKVVRVPLLPGLGSTTLMTVLWMVPLGSVDSTAK